MISRKYIGDFLFRTIQIPNFRINQLEFDVIVSPFIFNGFVVTHVPTLTDRYFDGQS